MPALVIRTDADASIGLGHLARCLALARGFDGRRVVAVAGGGQQVREQVAGAGATLAAIDGARGSAEDARSTVDIARRERAPWIVVDGYRFDSAYVRSLAAEGFRVLQIDDNGEAGEYAADLVLNQNLHAVPAIYARRSPRTRLLLGPDYVLLRSQFASRPPEPRGTPPIARRVLVTLGGGSAAGALATVIDALGLVAIPDLEVTVVAGALADRSDAVRAPRGARLTVIEHTDRMRDLMVWADLAISAGGSTSWELAYMGVPAAVLIVAANQEGAVGALASRGMVDVLGTAGRLETPRVAAAIETLARDDARRARMSAAGRALIDGRGVSRVIEAMADGPPAQNR